MPTMKQVRAAIIGRVKAHWDATYPGVKMYYDNAYPQGSEVDNLSTYVLCSIRFSGGAQMDISPTPNHRIRGRVVFMAACRDGAGSSKVLEYLDSLSGAMRFAQFGGVVTQEPMPGVPLADSGWFSYDLGVSFYADSIN